MAQCTGCESDVAETSRAVARTGDKPNRRETRYESAELQKGRTEGRKTY